MTSWRASRNQLETSHLSICIHTWPPNCFKNQKWSVNTRSWLNCRVQIDSFVVRADCVRPCTPVFCIAHCLSHAMIYACAHLFVPKLSCSTLVAFTHEINTSGSRARYSLWECPAQLLKIPIVTSETLSKRVHTCNRLTSG